MRLFGDVATRNDLVRGLLLPALSHEVSPALVRRVEDLRRSTVEDVVALGA